MTFSLCDINLREYISNLVTVIRIPYFWQKSYVMCVSRYFRSSSYLNSVARNQIRKYASGDGEGRWSWQHTSNSIPVALIDWHLNFPGCCAKIRPLYSRTHRHAIFRVCSRSRRYSADISFLPIEDRLVSQQHRVAESWRTGKNHLSCGSWEIQERTGVINSCYRVATSTDSLISFGRS